ncbi:MAG: nicotinate phosphoribosyltransferase [Firmicutes bacterium]|nr:nicotinate phosphoribosyltransferase [Bacillota bacterium]MCL5064747.1 nicotinate phosphoribosyltransferase [Bacillota bacterium]
MWQYQPDHRAIRSATPEEIAAGLTADAYFVGTQQILDHMGLADTEVTAEIFSNHSGVLAGVDEAVSLLRGQGVSVEALEEGSNVSAKTVVVRIRGPYRAFGIYETAMLGALASASGWATAARTAVAAAGGVPVISFGARHVHPAVASVLDRAALVGGCVGASSILGARQAGLLPSGTMPHALLLMVGDTVTAAEAYDQVMPASAPRVVLVDTFHDETEEALRVARAMGDRLQSVRLDTPKERGGVTPDLVRELRQRLDQAGFERLGIFVSGGITPERMEALREAGVTGFGVGSYIAGAPPLDMTMDLKEVDGKPIAKRGRIPGITPQANLVRKF